MSHIGKVYTLEIVLHTYETRQLGSELYTVTEEGTVTFSSTRLI